MKWRNVASAVMAYIEQRNLCAGAPLPSDRQFAELCKCSLQPVVRAMQELSNKGFIVRRPGATSLVGTGSPILDDSSFSFSHAAREVYHHDLKSKVIELSHRTPLCGELGDREKEAQRFLGLRRQDAFYVIARLRTFNGQHRAIHRSYLNPALFDHQLLMLHDFSKESMIRIFNECGYRIDSRQTVLEARFPHPEEASILEIGHVPVLSTQQETTAIQVSTGERFAIEFMLACYVDWQYRIADRVVHVGEEKDGLAT